MNHSVIRVNKVLYVTMSCAVSMYACWQPTDISLSDILTSWCSSNRPETARRHRDPTLYLIRETTETPPTGALSARSVVVDNDSQSIKRVLLHTLLFDFCFVLLD